MRNLLSPKQTKFHVLRYVNICFSAAMSGDNSLQTPKKTYTSSVIRCLGLCGSVKDVLHCKNVFKKATDELLALAEAVFGGTLQRHELRRQTRQRDKFLVWRGPLPSVFNCHGST